MGGETQIRDAVRTFWPQIPTVRRGARGLGLRPEATLGLRLIPLKRGFAPPESYPVAPPAAPEAPRQESAPGRDRGAARASEAFPQVPWTAPSSRRPSSAPQPARSAHLDGRRQRAALLEDSTYLPMVVRPGSTQLSGFEVRFLVSGPAARGYAPAAAGCRPRAEHPRRQPAATVADADAAAPRRRRQLPRRRRRRRRRRPRRRHRHRHRRHPTHRRRRRRRRSHYPRRRHRRRRSSRRRSRRRRRRRHRPCRCTADADAPPRAPYPVPVPPVPMSPLPLPLPPAMTPPPKKPKKPTMPSARRRRCCRSSAHAEGHGRRRGDADAGVGWV